MMIDDDVGLKEEPEDTRYYIKMRPEALGVWANYMLCHYWELYLGNGHVFHYLWVLRGYEFHTQWHCLL